MVSPIYPCIEYMAETLLERTEHWAVGDPYIEVKLGQAQDAHPEICVIPLFCVLRRRLPLRKLSNSYYEVRCPRLSASKQNYPPEEIRAVVSIHIEKTYNLCDPECTR